MSPTQRALALCKANGWPAKVVETWNSHVGIRQDMFGCIDIMVLDDEPGYLAIQACSGSNISARVKKSTTPPVDKKGDLIEPWPLLRHLERGNRFEVWGWRPIVAYKKDGTKAARPKWELRRVVVTIQDLMQKHKENEQ